MAFFFRENAAKQALSQSILAVVTIDVSKNKQVAVTRNLLDTNL